MAAQHMVALARANDVRIGIAEIKNLVRVGDMSVAEAMLEPAMSNVWLTTLLQAQHRWGETRARRFCVRVPISEMRKIGDLTERQRRLILDELECPR